MSVAVGTAISLGIAAGTAGAGIYSANKQSHAAEQGAQLQTAAANHSADLQSASQKDALDFSKQQAEVDARNQEQARRANYDQWAAREQRLSTFGQMVGLPSRNIPAYHASQDPNYTPGNPAPTIPSTIGAAAGKPAAGGDYQSLFNSITGGKPLDQNGLMSLAPQLKQAGFNITPPSAAGTVSKIQTPDGQWVRVLNGDTSVASPTVWVPQGGASGSSGAARALPATIGQAAQYVPLAVSPGLQLPTIGGMVR